MMLVNKKVSWSLNTIIAGSLAVGLVSLFVLTWRQTSFSHLFLDAILTFVIFALTKNEINQNREELIHGAIVSLTILPWVFYLLMKLVNFAIIF